MTFQAGQFVVLEAAGIAGGRAYSMVNFEADIDRIALLLKRKPGGRFSDWLFDNPSSDAEVDVFGPLGRAVFRPQEDRNIVCIAGGSGIAGMMSILECAAQADHFRTHKGVVFFGVRTLEDTFYLEQLSRLRGGLARQSRCHHCFVRSNRGISVARGVSRTQARERNGSPGCRRGDGRPRLQCDCLCRGTANHGR